MTTPMPAAPYAVPAGPRLRSPAALARATAVLLGLVVATDLLACSADLLEMDVAGDVADGGTGADLFDRADRADRADALFAAAGTAQGAALVATAVVALCWLWRIRVNAEVFDASRHRLRRGWTIGAWFCPVVNLWFPRRIVADSWDASTRVADRGYGRAGTADELREAAGTMLFSDCLDVVAAVLTFVVVTRLTRLQERKVLSGELPAHALG
ncbi:DUF4328 domain-containing protein [Streptomyces longwoodensis]|uniref:DUF4328 domain-containing protein n=1 Tax=Streptomyces longwoodensis TaxID=68231 RepID=UPI0033D05734